MTHRLRLAAFLIAALPLAGCGNKGPLTLQPQGESPPPMPAEAASQALAGAESVAAPAAVTGPPDPTQSSQTVAPPAASTVAPPPTSTVAPPADASDDDAGTPR